MLSFTILTQNACAALSQLHHRMPVMLASDSFEAWLGGADPACDARIAGGLRIASVSPRMNAPHYNEPGCVEPLAPKTQPSPQGERE